MQHPQIQSNEKFYLSLILAILMIGITTASVQIEKKIQLSSKRAHFSTIQVEDRVFFVGGFELHDYIATNTIEIYNLTSEAWEQPINLPSPRGRVATAVLGPYIYMVGGCAYTPPLYKLNADTQTFTSFASTNGPTVRRPIRMELSNTTLTVVGRYSVDFLDLATKNWTHNENLTNVMSQLWSTTTLSIRNFVIVMGGFNGTTLLPSTSIWVTDAITSAPIEFKDSFPANTTGFIGFWFDDTHKAAVIQFTNRCFVYHTPSQQWFQREASNNTIASVSFLNSTMVFFSDGFWTLDWVKMNSTWTSLNQVTFAFTVADQLVYCAANTMSVVTSLTTVTQPVNFGSPLLDVAMSPTIHVLVNSSGAVFMYISASKQLVLVTETIATEFSPTVLFRVNDTTVYIIGYLALYKTWAFAINSNQQLTNLSQIPFIPDTLINNYFYYYETGQSVPVDNLLSRTFGDPFPTAVVARLGDVMYMIPFQEVNPTGSVVYKAIDVYNYVENRWETTIPFPKFSSFGLEYVTIAILDGSFCIMDYSPALYRLNASGLFDTIQFTNNKKHGPGRLLHPTYWTPVVMNNDTAYLIDITSGLFVTSLTGAVALNSPEISGTAQQAWRKDNKVVSSVVYNNIYRSIVIYNTDTNVWRGLLLLQPATMVSIAVYDDFLLAFGDKLDSMDYLDLATEQWLSLPFDNPYVPASIFKILPSSTSQSSNVSNAETLVIAGGYHKLSNLYTEEIQFVSFDLTPVTESPVPAVEQPLTEQITSPIAEDNSTLIIAIVIPIAVVVIAAVLLTVLLLRRRRQQKRSMTISMTGLEQQHFGQWFVPYQDITFGEQLGQGANGQVFKGKWKNTDVALKVSMAQANQSVVSELSMMIGLRPHPNVVQLFGFSVHPETNSVILILEFCNGGSLDATLYQHGEVDMDIKMKMYWLKSVCKGIGHLHSNNIVHRDIAARNVLLHQGEPKLTDFGMSRLVDEQQHGTTKSELGPIRWMAPESLGEKRYSPKSDVWSFGILMFEILERQEPHLNEDPITIGMQIRDQGVIPQLVPSAQCPSELISVMKQCCQMSPSARPTIDQVLEKLEHLPLLKSA